MSTATPLRTLLDRPAPMLLVAGALCLLEGVVSTIFGIVAAFQIHPDRAVVTVGTTVVMVGYGVGMLLAGRGLWRHRGWARGLAVCGQLLHLPIAWSFLQGAVAETMWIGVLLAVVSVAILVCVFWPSSIRAYADPNGPAGQH